MAIQIALFAIVAAFLISRIPLSSLPEYEEGDTAAIDISTPVELEVIDLERTAQLRQEEAEKIPPLFRFDPEAVEDVGERLRSTFNQTRGRFLEALEETFKHRNLSDREVSSARFGRFVRSFQAKNTAFPVGLTLAQLWAQGESGEEIQARLILRLQGVMGYRIHADELPPGAESGPSQVRIVRRDASLSPERVEQIPTVSRSALYTLTRARDELRDSLASEERPYEIFLAGLLKENCFYDGDLTRQIRAKKTGSITANKRYNRRDVIVRRGETISPQIKVVIDQLRMQTASQRSGWRFLGLLFISLILLFALWRFARRTQVYSLSTMKIFTLAGFALMLQVAAVRLGIEVADVIGYRIWGDFDSPQSYQFAIPFAAAALLAVLLLESRLALMIGFLVSLFTLLLTGDTVLTIYAAVSGIIAVYGVGRYQQRGAITKVGVMIAVGNAILVVILMLVSGPSLQLRPTIFSMFCGVLGGVFASALTSFALPLGESLFDILTDVKLLELSNAELPLLKRLAIEAPGTYQHSFIVATLAEAAAKVVVAKSLLVRIGSYYHDIGKLSNPHMYVENQRRSFNPHELLTPEESASIIIKHVTEGIRMAHEEGLPQAVIDLIPQHHGTRQLYYFFVKAEQLAEQKGTAVDEAVFRYPGPKPQSIEAAIVMMADSAEASTRSLKDPSPENIDRLLTKLIEAIIKDGQLDECNLRMRDVKEIKASFVETLSNVHHHRIPYPGFTEKELAALPIANYETVWTASAEIGQAGETPAPVRND